MSGSDKDNFRYSLMPSVQKVIVMNVLFSVSSVLSVVSSLSGIFL